MRYNQAFDRLGNPVYRRPRTTTRLLGRALGILAFVLAGYVLQEMLK